MHLHISGWKTVYQNSPRKMVENFGLKWPKYKNQILGGEAAMWSEQVDIILEITFKQFWAIKSKRAEFYSSAILCVITGRRVCR